MTWSNTYEYKKSSIKVKQPTDPDEMHNGKQHLT